MKFCLPRVNRSKFLFYILSFYIILFYSYLIANRSTGVGDTYQYIIHYERIAKLGDYNYKFEPGFNFVSYFVSFLDLGYVGFFFVVSFFITLTYIFLFREAHYKITGRLASTAEVLLFFSILFASSWYITSVTNGLRQGLSLPFLYLAIFFLVFKSGFFKVLLFLAISVSFHYSSLLIFPFLCLSRVSFGKVLFAWGVAAFGYILGVNENIVKFLSDFYELGFYEKIKYYSIDEGGTGSYHGFVLIFYVYTLFWPFLFLCWHLFKYKALYENSFAFIKIAKIYLILSFPYLFFGFGPYSNRYAYIAWFFIPVFQYFFAFCYFREVVGFIKMMSFPLLLLSSLNLIYHIYFIG